MEPLAPAHAPRLFAGLGDVRLYTYIPEDPPASLAALTARYEHLAAGSRKQDEIWRNWVMFAASNGEPLGTLQATVFADGRALIAYMLLAPYWGHGYATEGVQWMLHRIAREDHVVRAEAYIDTRNQPSLRLVKRLGFQHRTTIAGADTFKGASSDEHVYEMSLRALTPGAPPSSSPPGAARPPGTHRT
ncbi:GNAT family N-acetyltransferase [Pendulispora albinea]|uniref:GNAT family N-acetyltransferase n=1 Tax=Pendulispora albinea TaxID=2741071 RepID=A0ABZ2LSB3_9BACT